MELLLVLFGLGILLVIAIPIVLWLGKIIFTGNYTVNCPSCNKKTYMDKNLAEDFKYKCKCGQLINKHGEIVQQ